MATHRDGIIDCCCLLPGKLQGWLINVRLKYVFVIASDRTRNETLAFVESMRHNGMKRWAKSPDRLKNGLYEALQEANYYALENAVPGLGKIIAEYIKCIS